jgi:glycosyltransferase involved in cell wall biosynthesis
MTAALRPAPPDPAITVVTATRNRLDFLRRCVDNVAAQSYEPYEHIVIDGASSDGTREWLFAAAQDAPHLRFISEADTGLSQALNKGLALARGDLVGVLGDDDVYEPGAFAAVAQAFAQQPDACLVAGACHFVTSDDRILFTQQASYTGWSELIECWHHWGHRVCLPAPSTFIARRALDVVGGFDEGDRYAMDYGHWIRLLARFPDVVTIPAPLARFRYDAGTISKSQVARQWEETLRISRQHWGDHGVFKHARFFWSYYAHERRRRKTNRRGRA